MVDLPVTIATSICPGRLDQQRQAIDSWIAQGFQVVSVNTALEIAAVQQLFPTVHFVKDPCKSGTLPRSSCISINSLLNALRDSGSPVCGIVNSDVVLRSTSSIYTFMAKEALSALICGTRMDVDPITGDHVSEYRLGLDFFFFPAVFINDYPEAGFFLGKPCWEYWFLFTSLFQGKPAKRLIESIAFHDAHHQTWDKNELAAYGHELIRSLLSSTQHYKVRTATHSRFINILSEGDLGRIFSEVIKYTRVYLPMVHFSQSDTADVLLAYDTYIAELRTYLGDADIQMDTMLASRSWRITAPFRFLATVLRNNQ